MRVNVPIPASAGWIRGDDFSFSWPAALDSAGVARDISGFAITFTMRHAVDDPNTVLTYAMATGLSGTAAGVLTMASPDTDTDTIEPGEYVYAAKRTTAGSEETLFYGTVQLLRMAGA